MDLGCRNGTEQGDHCLLHGLGMNNSCITENFGLKAYLLTTSLGSPALLLPSLLVWNGSRQFPYYLERHLHNLHKEHSDTVASVESITSILNKDGFVLSQRILMNVFMLAAAILVVSRIVLPYLAVASSKTPLPLIYCDEALHLRASPYLTNV